MKSENFINGFAIGFFTCGAIILVTAVLSSCAGTNNVPPKERMLIDTDIQIQALQKRRASIVKSIAEDKEREREERLSK